jgi:hypothetical protein
MNDNSPLVATYVLNMSLFAAVCIYALFQPKNQEWNESETSSLFPSSARKPITEDIGSNELKYTVYGNKQKMLHCKSGLIGNGTYDVSCED